MSPLDEEVRAWAEKNPDEPQPAAAPHADAPGSTATPIPPPPASSSSSSSSAEDDDEEPSKTALGFDEVAELGVAIIDFGLQNFVSERCAFKPAQKKELAGLGAKVLKKYLPDVAGAVEPEYAFVGAIALFAYSNYTSSPEPAKAAASPAGGSDGASGHSGDPSKSTEATVDGRQVVAEVLQ